MTNDRVIVRHLHIRHRFHPCEAAWVYNARMSSKKGKSQKRRKQEWYADGLRFECTQCGNCCTGPPGYVWFNNAETEAMAKSLGMSPVEFREKYAHRHAGKWTLNEVKNEQGHYDCVFLERDENGKGLADRRPRLPGDERRAGRRRQVLPHRGHPRHP